MSKTIHFNTGRIAIDFKTNENINILDSDRGLEYAAKVRLASKNITPGSFLSLYEVENVHACKGWVENYRQIKTREEALIALRKTEAQFAWVDRLVKDHNAVANVILQNDDINLAEPEHRAFLNTKATLQTSQYGLTALRNVIAAVEANQIQIDDGQLENHVENSVEPSAPILPIEDVPTAPPPPYSQFASNLYPVLPNAVEDEPTKPVPVVRPRTPAPAPAPVVEQRPTRWQQFKNWVVRLFH